MGRDSIISEEIISSICADLAEGYTLAVAYGNAGIGKETFFRWYNRGKEADAEKIYRDFWYRVDVAKFAGRKKLEKRVVNSKDPKVALTVLSRLYRDDWGEKVDINATVGGHIDVIYTAVPRPPQIETEKKEESGS